MRLHRRDRPPHLLDRMVQPGRIQLRVVVVVELRAVTHRLLVGLPHRSMTARPHLINTQTGCIHQRSPLRGKEEKRSAVACREAAGAGRAVAEVACSAQPDAVISMCVGSGGDGCRVGVSAAVAERVEGGSAVGLRRGGTCRQPRSHAGMGAEG